MSERKSNLRLFLIALIAISVLGGCSKLKPKLDEVLPDKRIAYKKSKSLPDLEVPPDLTTDAIRDQMAIPQGGETASYSTFQERQANAKKQRELSNTQDSAIQVLDNEHILAVQGAAVQIWPQLQTFWQELGYDLELDDEELGVVETEWRENQEELTRNKFKIFAEAGEEQNTTVLYVSHRGEQLIPQGEKLVWQPRAREVETERALVERLREHLGAIASGDYAASTGNASGYEDDSSQEQPTEQRAEMLSAGSGKIYISLQEEFSDAWESTELALSQASINVEEADKSRGVYSIKMSDAPNEKKDGVFSKLKFWGDKGNTYQLSLTGVGAKTELVLLNEDGKWETSEEGTNLLRNLHRQLNQGASR